MEEDFKYSIKEIQAEIDGEEYFRECVDIARFLECCRACSGYGGRWSCPPFERDTSEIWRNVKKVVLYARLLLPAFEGQSMKAASRALVGEKKPYAEFLLRKEAQNPGSLALLAGSCSICEKCERAFGRPCRFPERMRPSLEACGGNIEKSVSKYLGYPLLWATGDEAPGHLMLVGALLLK